MAQVKHGDIIRVHYAGKFADGTVFETSHDREPLQYKMGEGRVLTGFEEAAVGMKPGEFKSIKIAAEDAYGPHRRSSKSSAASCRLISNRKWVSSYKASVRMVKKLFLW